MVQQELLYLIEETSTKSAIKSEIQYHNNSYKNLNNNLKLQEHRTKQCINLFFRFSPLKIALQLKITLLLHHYKSNSIARKSNSDKLLGLKLEILSILFTQKKPIFQQKLGDEYMYMLCVIILGEKYFSYNETCEK